MKFVFNLPAKALLLTGSVELASSFHLVLVWVYIFFTQVSHNIQHSFCF